MDIIKEKAQGLLDAYPFKGQEETGQMNDLEKYKRKKQQEKKARRIMLAAVVVLVLVVILFVKYVVEHRTYDSYQVVETSEQLDSSILHYKELGGYVLKYSGDGVSLLNASDDVVWNDSIQMTSPVVESFGDVAAVYEPKGTVMGIYGTEGKLGEIKTEYPILKASISAKGGVAMLLENDINTLMHYYAYDGSLIASSVSNMKNPGYPVDLSVSEDGLSMAVTYFVADGDAISSYLAFYNFGEAGKNKEDNLMDGFRFDGILVPEVRYMDDDTLVAYRENGFTVYRGTDIVEEIKQVEFEDEIVSSFSGNDIFGFVFSGSDNGHAFEMKVYNSSGALRMETGFDIVYDQIKISDSQIILHNAGQLAIIDSNGTVRFSGNFEEGKILDVIKKGMNRYAVACDKGVVTIVLD